MQFGMLVGRREQAGELGGEPFIGCHLAVLQDGVTGIQLIR
jgi:hypothetical protein